MKKVLATVTFLALTVAAIFAANGDKLEITAKIAEVKPSFQMYGSFDTTYDKLAGSAENTLTSDKDISVNDITVNVKVLQNNTAKYAKSFSLTVSATNLINGSSSATATCSAATSKVANNDNLTVGATKENATATFNMTYTNGKPVAANTEIGIASFTWASDANLPAGNYSASITLSYAAN